MTTKLSVSLSDETAAYVREHAGGNVSAFIERAVRRLMLQDALRDHRVPDWGDRFAEAAEGGFRPEGERRDG